jgi:hypothetical protein
MVSPPESDMRIVRNHIDSPAAPQPSRVTPLAITETPRLVQERRASYAQTRPRRDPGHESIRTSPDIPTQPIQPRKRRKLDVKRASRKRGAASPDVMIKDEPISPPPFHESKPLGSARSRPIPSRPILIDDDPPPQEVHYVLSQTYVRPSTQAIYDSDRMLPRSEPRALSRAGWREVPHDYQDLRKVASLQHMREAQRPYDNDSVLLTTLLVRNHDRANARDQNSTECREADHEAAETYGPGHSRRHSGPCGGMTEIPTSTTSPFNTPPPMPASIIPPSIST